MLAATPHTTVVDWIIGSIAAAVVLGLLVMLVVSLVRRFTPEVPRRSLERVESAVTIPPADPSAPLWKRTLRARMPIWLAFPMLFLGFGFVVIYPFGRDWRFYGSALVVGVLSGFWARRRYHSRVLYRGKGEVVTWTWIGPAKDQSALPPVIVEPRDGPTNAPTGGPALAAPPD